MGARKVPAGHFNAHFQSEDYSDFPSGGSVEERRWTGGVPRLISAACFCSSAKAVRGKSVPGEKPDSVIQKGLLFFLIPQMSNNCTL